MARNTVGTPRPQDGEIRRERDGNAVPVEPTGQMMTGATRGMQRPVGVPDELVQATQVVSPRDGVRWGPIWAGLLTTFTSFLILEFLGVGLGLISAANGNAGSTSGISSGIAALIAFFLGGWVAEATSVARGGSAGLINGFLVWALGVSLILLLSILGLSTLFGALGNIAGQFLAAGHSVTTPQVGSPSSGQVASVTQSAGWGAFLTMVITALAAALGGLVASRGRAIGRVRQ